MSLASKVWNRKDYAENPEKWDKRNKAWAEKNPEKVKEHQKKAFAKYREKNPEKYRAHYMVNNAIRAGKIHRPNVCERCGAEQFTEASHNDYDKPLEIEWLCRPCHRGKDGLSRIKSPVGGRSLNL